MGKLQVFLEEENKDQVDPNKLEVARGSYLNFVAIDDIALALGIPRTKLLSESKKWENEREDRLQSTMIEIQKITAKEVAGVIKVSLPLLRQAIEQRAVLLERIPMAMNEIKMLADVISNMDKLIRLEMERPTEITAQHVDLKPMSIDELRKIFAKDKFRDVVNVECEEVKPC